MSSIPDSPAVACAGTVVVEINKLVVEIRRIDEHQRGVNQLVGLALVSVSKGAEGLSILRQACDRNFDAPAAWDALLAGLGLANLPQEFADVYSHLPSKMAADPRFAKHLGRLRQDAGQWSDAAAAFRCSWDHEPDNTVGYRLHRALFLAGQTDEAKRWEELVLDYREAFKKVRGLAVSANTALSEGHIPDPELCQRIAALRTRMRRLDESHAWQQLALGQSPAPQAVGMRP